MVGKVNILCLICISSLLAPETHACLSSPKLPEDSKPPHTSPGGTLDSNRTTKPTTSTTEKYPTTETSNATISIPTTSHPITNIPTTSIPTTSIPTTSIPTTSIPASLVATQPNQPANTESTETTNQISTRFPSSQYAVFTSTESIPYAGSAKRPSLGEPVVLPPQMNPDDPVSSSNDRPTSNAGSLSCAVLFVLENFF